MARWVERLKEWRKKIGTFETPMPDHKTKEFLRKQYHQRKLNIGDSGTRNESDEGVHDEKD